MDTNVQNKFKLSCRPALFIRRTYRFITCRLPAEQLVFIFLPAAMPKKKKKGWRISMSLVTHSVIFMCLWNI